MPILRESIKSNARDMLGTEDEIDKLKKLTRTLEDKLEEQYKETDKK